MLAAPIQERLDGVLLAAVAHKLSSPADVMYVHRVVCEHTQDRTTFAAVRAYYLVAALWFFFFYHLWLYPQHRPRGLNSFEILWLPVMIWVGLYQRCLDGVGQD